MAYAYIWPVSLPQSPQENFTETGGNIQVLRTSPDMGPAKQRRRGFSVRTMQLNFWMTDAQVATLKTFVVSTLKGVARFGFTHPTTGVTEEVRFIPSGNGELYNLSYVSKDLWNVSMQFEVLP